MFCAGTVHYVGKLINGDVFDSSVARGTPAQFAPNRVIPGWTIALQLMSPGDKWILTIPSELAYGEKGSGSKIPANSVLIFEVELISFRAPSFYDYLSTNTQQLTKHNVFKRQHYEAYGCSLIL